MPSAASVSLVFHIGWCVLMRLSVCVYRHVLCMQNVRTDKLCKMCTCDKQNNVGAFHLKRNDLQRAVTFHRR